MGIMDSAYDKQFWTLDGIFWAVFRDKVIQTKGASFTIELPDVCANFWDYGSLVNSSGHFEDRWYFESDMVTSRGIQDSLREIGITHLPEGIRIEKIPIRNNDGLRIKKVRVYVSGECSSYIFKTYYADIGIPFCNLLLSKYEDLLEDIRAVVASKWYKYHYDEYPDCCNGPVLCFLVSNEGISADNGHLGLEGYYYFAGNGGMQSLLSVGQQYGMALALIEIWKKNYPELKNFIPKIIPHGNNQGIYVRFEKKPAPPPVKPKELKEW